MATDAMTDAGEKLEQRVREFQLSKYDGPMQTSLLIECVRAELERVLDIVETDPAHAVERIERLMQ